MLSCKECGLPLEGKECEGEIQSVYDMDDNVVGTAKGHPGICCDCYDEQWGMPEYLRQRPKPNKDS